MRRRALRHCLTHLVTRRLESTNCLNKAAEYFTDLGRLSIAAKHFKVSHSPLPHPAPRGFLLFNMRVACPLVLEP
jgi:hypothetical protein